ncbi:MAG: shikimate kinase, partial [Rhodobacterales bacterium]|nr:shikimate kinase [Rhodobacterales bacterium]
VDTDHLIAINAGMSIPEIFAQQGESGFREQETEALKLALQTDSCVLATGGGIIKKPENRALLKQELQVVYLEVSVATQLLRTEGDTSRPLLLGQDRQAILEHLFAERDSRYREVATLVVDANQEASHVIAEINHTLAKRT